MHHKGGLETLEVLTEQPDLGWGIKDFLKHWPLIWVLNGKYLLTILTMGTRGQVTSKDLEGEKNTVHNKLNNTHSGWSRERKK